MMSEQHSSPKRKILVLGVELPTREVTSYRWDGIPPALNVADYDTVILDLSPFEIEATAEAVDVNSVPSFQQFARLLFSEGSEIIAIGRPFFSIGDGPFLESTWFLPLSPAFLNESGETMSVVRSEFGEYFEHVSSWSFCVGGMDQPNPKFVGEFMLEAGIRYATHLRPGLSAIAKNRYGHPIAFTIVFVAEGKDRRRLVESGIVTWLPPTTDILVGEAILILLRTRYGLLLEQTAPPWISGYSLPAERPIRERIDEIERQVGALVGELQELRDQLSAAENPKGILYQTGEEVLEPLVLEVLSTLGGTTEKPRTKGKEDGRLTDPAGRLATVEIKGRAGPLKLSDVRQVDQWVADRITYEGEESKGILVGNLNRDQAPSNRGEVLPPNCIDAARNLGISIVSTTQLFVALTSYQEGKLNTTAFWDALFGANGAVDLPDV